VRGGGCGGGSGLVLVLENRVEPQEHKGMAHATVRMDVHLLQLWFLPALDDWVAPVHDNLETLLR
jgi:hypothetical protein